MPVSPPLITAIAPKVAENLHTVVMLAAAENMPEVTLAPGMTSALLRSAYGRG